MKKQIKKQMPEDWEPPFPAHVAKFDDDLGNMVMAYFGVQHKHTIPVEALQCIEDMTEQKNGPLVVEKAIFTDTADYKNQVYICYWNDQTACNEWMKNSFLTFWDQTASDAFGDCGFWREVLGIPTDYFETLFPNPKAAGIARLADSFSEPVLEHGYWGGMRDRIPASSHDDFSPEQEKELTIKNSIDTLGKRVKVIAPGNLNLIRSAQDWTQSQGSERELYLKDVHPALLEGMAFLKNNPLETGCCYLRFMTEVSDDNEPLERTFGMGMFLSMSHLEAWSKSHPTHLKIFNSFIEFAQEIGDDMTLNLWHEVSVLPKGSGDYQYLNCHWQTGLIPYFQVEEL